MLEASALERSTASHFRELSMAQVFDIDAPIDDDEDDNYVATCPDCESEDFEIVCTRGGDSRFSVVKLSCRECETEMHVENGLLV